MAFLNRTRLRPLLRFLACCCLALGVQTQAQEAQEHQDKPAYLYRFMSYVEWPAESLPAAGEPLVIAVAGADDVADELSRIVALRQVNGHPLAVRRLGTADTIDGLHVLFVGDRARTAALLRTAEARPVLTVTDARGALPTGSVIDFHPFEGRLRFDVSLSAASRKQLKVSSRLLSLAVHVEGTAQ